MAQRNIKKIAAIAALPLLLGGWALFRPELALVNQTVNEAAPSASDSKVLSEGTFASFAHETTGKASVLTVDGKQVLRLSGFKTSNGPDVHVLLVKGKDSKSFGNDYLDLGVIKGNIGDQNYELPAGTDASSYQAVSIWCKRFNVTFGGAELMNSGQAYFKTAVSTPVQTQLASVGEEIMVTGGVFAGTKGRADLIEGSGKRFIRLSGASAGKSKSIEVYIVKKETFTKDTDFNSVTKTRLGTLATGKKQEFSVSKDLDLWLYRSVVLWDSSSKKVIGAAPLRSAQEAKPKSSLMLV